MTNKQCVVFRCCMSEQEGKNPIAYLFVFVGDHVDALGEGKHRGSLGSHVKNPDLGIGDTTVES